MFVVALLAESVIAVGIGLGDQDSAQKIAAGLNAHQTRLLLIAYLSIVYATAFLVYLSRLYDLVGGEPDRPRGLGSLVLVGGVLFVTLHAVSDIGITGMLGARFASYGYQHDPGLSYTLYYVTFALDSVADVFGSLFVLTAGLVIIRSGVLPRWLGWTAIVVGSLFFLQGFGLGGVISRFGLVLDLIGFVLFLVFVLASSVIMLRRDTPGPLAAGGVE